MNEFFENNGLCQTEGFADEGLHQLIDASRAELRRRNGHPTTAEEDARAEVGRALGLNAAPTWQDVAAACRPIVIRIDPSKADELRPALAKLTSRGAYVTQAGPVVPLVDGAGRPIGTATVDGPVISACITDAETIKQIHRGTQPISVGYMVTETSDGVLHRVKGAPVSFASVVGGAPLAGIVYGKDPTAPGYGLPNIEATTYAVAERAAKIAAQRQPGAKAAVLSHEAAAIVQVIVELIAQGDR